MTKDNQLCLQDEFAETFTLECSVEGNPTFLIVEPTLASHIGNDEPLRGRALIPNLKVLERGVIIFQPLMKIEKKRVILDDMFISNCIESKNFFQGMVVVGVRRSRQEQCMVMTNDGFAGEWTYTKTTAELSEHSLMESYLNPQEEQSVRISQNLVSHAVRLMLRTEDELLLSNLSISVTVAYAVEEQNEEKLNRTIIIQPSDLRGKLPIRLHLFFQEHLIRSVSLVSTHMVHFVMEAVPHEEAEYVKVNLKGAVETEIPIIE